MATEVLSFPIKLRANANKFNPAYQKYFAETDKREPLNLKGFGTYALETYLDSQSSHTK